MEWALLGLGIVFAFFSWVIIQGTRAALAWRRAIAAGDVDIIRQVVEETLGSWRSMKRPKEVPPNVWRGIQGMQLVSVDAQHIRASLTAEGEYRLEGGRWVETASPLEEGFAIAAKALEMLLYDIPNVRLPWVQVDVYTSFRDASGHASRQCILSTVARREIARNVDWDNWSAREIVDYLGGRYHLDEAGQPRPVEPEVLPIVARREPEGKAR